MKIILCDIILKNSQNCPQNVPKKHYLMGYKYGRFTGSTIRSETLYFVDYESADGRSEKYLDSNERYIH